MIKGEIGTDCRVIGEVVPPGEGLRVLLPGGVKLPVTAVIAGWDHFAVTGR